MGVLTSSEKSPKWCMSWISTRSFFSSRESVTFSLISRTKPSLGRATSCLTLVTSTAVAFALLLLSPASVSSALGPSMTSGSPRLRRYAEIQIRCERILTIVNKTYLSLFTFLLFNILCCIRWHYWSRIFNDLAILKHHISFNARFNLLCGDYICLSFGNNFFCKIKLA